MKKQFIAIILLLLTLISFSQDTFRYDKWGTFTSSSNSDNVDKTLIRTGIGFQKSFYSELGLARRIIFGESMFIGSRIIYSAIEYTPVINPNKDNAIYGLKIGWGINMMGSGLALEAKYATDLKINDLILTPKIGFDGFGDLYIYYGYNISFNKTPYNYQGHHQFSIGCSLLNLTDMRHRRMYKKKQAEAVKK